MTETNTSIDTVLEANPMQTASVRDLLHGALDLLLARQSELVRIRQAIAVLEPN